MCFFIHPEHPKEMTADKDIKCYKTMNFIVETIFKKDKINLRSDIVSPYRTYHYKLGKTYIVENLVINKDFGQPSITVGLHSYINFYRADFAAENHGCPMIIECLIPKGAKYYYDPSRFEYVSTKLKFVDIKMATYFEMYQDFSGYNENKLDFTKVLKSGKDTFTYPEFIELLMD